MPTIILSDDEPHIINTLKQMIPWEKLSLELLGVATDGKELRTLIETHHPQIVITDIVMPELTGLDVAGMVRNRYPDIHFILMSAYADFQYARSALQLGLDDLLPKPIIRSELNQALVKACRAINASAPAADDTDNPTIRRIKEYVLIHYGEKISLDTAAEQVYMNPAYLSRLFKQETGENFTDYLLHIRMEAAKKMLKEGTANISEIADAIGFGSSKYFTKIFHKETGYTPSEYRQGADR